MQQGLRYHKANDLLNAQKYYLKSLEAQQDNYESLQLLGALLHKQKKHSKAIDYLRRSLSISPKQAHVSNTLANAYLANGNIDSALNEYEQAISIKADYFDPYINLFRCFVNQRDDERAADILGRAKRYFPQHWRVFYFQAQLFRAKYDYKQSIDCLEQSNVLSPNNHLILHDLGLSYRLSGQTNLALEVYRQVEQTGHRSAEFHHNYANALSDVSKNELALEHYAKALDMNPRLRDTLLNWCELMWESGKAEHMFIAYENALKSDSVPVEIYFDYIQKLIRVKNIKVAIATLERMENQYPCSDYLTVCRVIVKRIQRDYEYDFSILDSVMNASDLDIEYKLLVIEYLIESAKPEYAYEQLEKLRVLNGDNQHLLALLHTCSRIVPNLEYPFSRLEDYLFEYQIKAPEGQSLASYLANLKDYLLALHQAKAQPLEQTLQHGTQTRGNLFDNDHPLLKHIKDQYIEALAKYRETVSQLPPLYKGFWQQEEYDFIGSWSVALKQNGYHNNHFHPMGWLSSACYISLPELNDDHDAGYFQIGIPNLNDGKNLGLGLPPLKQVKPKLGKLVLFPSCLWHGTVPFSGDQIRLSIACDIVYKAT